MPVEYTITITLEIKDEDGDWVILLDLREVVAIVVSYDNDQCILLHMSGGSIVEYYNVDRQRALQHIIKLWRQAKGE